MSVVSGTKIVAYNVKLGKEAGKDRPMTITEIYRYAPKTATKADGTKAASRYRFAGHDADHPDQAMSLFTGEAMAKAAAAKLGLDIKVGVIKAKPAKKSCEEKCKEKREAKKAAKKPEPTEEEKEYAHKISEKIVAAAMGEAAPKPKAKSPAKKPAAKKSPAKKPAAKKPAAKKAAPKKKAAAKK